MNISLSKQNSIPRHNSPNDRQHLNSVFHSVYVPKKPVEQDTSNGAKKHTSRAIQPIEKSSEYVNREILRIKSSLLEMYKSQKYLDFQGQMSEAIQWGKLNYWHWYDSLSKDKKDLLNGYTNMSFAEMNGLLRKNRTIRADRRDEIKNNIRSLSKVLHTAVIPENLVVYRGIKKRTLERILEIEEIPYVQSTPIRDFEKLLTGKVLLEIGFMSTSLVKTVASKYMDKGEGFLLKINVPKGSNGAYLEELSYFNSEHEVLFDRNQFMIINAVKKVQDYHKHCLEIQCQLINKNDGKSSE